MRVTVPVYVRQHRPEGAPAPLFLARPLFVTTPHRVGTVLSRVLTRLSNDLRKALDAIARAANQRELADWTFNPLLERQTLDLQLMLRRQTVKARVLAVAFRSGEARLGFLPELPSLWFDIPAGESLSSRARDVLTAHLRKLEKDEEGFNAEELLGGKVTDVMVTSIDLDVELRPSLPKKEERAMFFLGASGSADGFDELNRVGRMLDTLYPDELERAVLRDAEVEELIRRLADTDRRPVLLLGPRGVGKTALVHETVRRRMERAAAGNVTKGGVWLLSPQRLVSGMSYVGQWEDRLLAILKVAAKRNEVLYFDDLLGLYFAGQSSQSTLSVADVMRPVIDRREFRMLAEMTPEAFRVLRERDRAMADLFDVLPVREPPEEQTRRILITVSRQLEDRHGCRFELDTLPTVLDLQRRYVRDVVMPGKGAELLRRLATSHARQTVARAQALEAFQSYSGLSTEFLDSDKRLRRQDVIDALSARVVSQPAALEAMADAVCVSRARLNDTTRPVATFLFLGPTGVGKTECAKALASYLFGAGRNRAANQASLQAQVDSAASKSESSADGDSRLLRFDMNEYVDPGAAGRLMGTTFEPDGLLAGAVRRQPFGVVLLDEIEKAHASVFDMLLAVLGEGRLTDARGRTADFSNMIIIMTSNLGVREAGVTFGLRPAGASDNEAHERYRDAARQFFRPEFFNRIDRVVPFDRLDRGDVANIARRLMDDLLKRDGLTGRRCVLRVDPAALARIVDSGYHPHLGARALKREVEKRLAMPVARRLATMPPGEPTVIDVIPSADRSLAVKVTPIRPCDPLPPRRTVLIDPAWQEPGKRVELLDELLDTAEAALVRLEVAGESLSPGAGLTQGELSARHFAYLAIREQVGRAGELVQRLDRAVEASTRPPSKNLRKGSRSPVPAAIPRSQVRTVPSVSSAWRMMLGGAGLPSFVQLPIADEHEKPLREAANDLLDELALLNAMTESSRDAQPDKSDGRLLLILRSQSEVIQLGLLAYLYVTAFTRQQSVQVEELEPPANAAGGQSAKPPRTVRAILVDLPGAERVFAGEQGTHLFLGGAGDGMTPIDVRLVPIDEGADAWTEAVRMTSAEPPTGQSSDSPHHIGMLREEPSPRVVRVYDSSSEVLDLRTGLCSEAGLGGDLLRRFMLASLPLPTELRDEEQTAAPSVVPEEQAN